MGRGFFWDLCLECRTATACIYELKACKKNGGRAKKKKVKRSVRRPRKSG
jgi:hypothetical protein